MYQQRNKQLKIKIMESTELKTIDTVVERLYIIMKENPTMDANKAIGLAFKQEQDFLSEMIEKKTERSKKATKQIYKNVYGLISILK